jgi:hypothetical protein
VRAGTVVAHGGAEPHNISSTTPTAQMSPFVLSQTAPRRSTKSSYERCGRGDPNAYRRVPLQCPLSPVVPRLAIALYPPSSTPQTPFNRDILLGLHAHTRIKSRRLCLPCP